MTQTTFEMLHNYDAKWRKAITDKGYADVTFTTTYEPVNDEFRVKLYFYNTDWSSTYLPTDMQTCSRFEVGVLIGTIDKWVRALPREEEAREVQLLKDFAKIKERIDASTLSDIIKAEVAAAMEKMSHNILEHDQSNVTHVVHQDGIGEGQPI